VRDVHRSRIISWHPRSDHRAGTAFKTAPATPDHTRRTIGAHAVGIEWGALDAANAYTEDRKQFGQ